MFIPSLILIATAMASGLRPPDPPPAGGPPGYVPAVESWTQEWRCRSAAPSSITIQTVQRPPSAIVTLVSLRIAGKRVPERRLVELRKLLSEASAPDRIIPACLRIEETISVKIFERPGVPPRREPFKLFFFPYE